MKKIILLMSILSTVLVACNQQTYTANNISGKWEIVAINDQAISYQGLTEIPYISFMENETQMVGNTGCNIFFGQMIIDENNAQALRFDAVGSTKVMCANMEVEDALFAALANVASIDGSGNTLLLKDSNGKVLLTGKLTKETH